MRNQILKVLVIVGSAAMLTACGGAFDATSGANVAASSQIDSAQLQVELQAVQAEAEQAIAEADALMSQVIKKDGSVNLNCCKANSNSVNPQLLEKPFEMVFEKILVAVGKIEDLFDKADAKIAAARAKLDPSNPLHAIALQELDKAAAKLAEVETQVGNKMVSLANKVDWVVQKIDLFLAGLNPILSLLLSGEVNKIKSAVMDFKTDLATVIAR